MTYCTDYWSQVAVKDATDCWLWQGRTQEDGYGVYKGQLSHRVALFLSGVPLDSRFAVDHQCQNKSCVSPFHLTVMVPRDHDRLTRARQRSAA